MNLEMLKNSNRILFECICGSHMYNLNTPQSDIDIKGMFGNTIAEDSGLIRQVTNHISDPKNDQTYVSLRKFMFELVKGSPNMLETLWCPENLIKITSPVYDIIRNNRNLFISKECYKSFSGYAMSQMKRARGQNKWINNPKPIEQPKKIDFCWFIDKEDKDYKDNSNNFPMRPRKPLPIEFNLWNSCHASKMEHSKDMYRIYDYTDVGGKGVFRGSSEQIVLESIPKEDENKRFVGILIFNEEEYTRAIKDHKNYWEWKRNRNESRYQTQEAGEIDYDSKNMMHLVRLFWSAENILTNGEPIVRFEGEQRNFLMDVRNGKKTYDELYNMAQEMDINIKVLAEKSDLPKKINVDKIEDLFIHTSKIADDIIKCNYKVCYKN